jgi:hypothetical protein
MVQGVERLRRASEVIRDEKCDRDALLEAAAEFWSATFDSDTWPIELQVKSLPARFQLIRHGSFEETIRRLSEADLRRLCNELIEVAELAERLNGQPR